MSSLAALEAAQTELGAATGVAAPAPGSAAFAAATATMNTRVLHHPAAVAIASDPSEVATVVRYASDHGLRVAVRSTGHGMRPVADDTLILDVSSLEAVTIDPGRRTATVGPGARWQQVLERAGHHGLGGLAGSSPTVGAVGFHLGGGVGPVSRAFGFSSDRVRSIDLVTASGDRVTATVAENPDLFWALRGGGGLGIVTSLTFELVPDTGLIGGGLYFAVEDAPLVVRRWWEWTHEVSDAVSTSVAIIDIPALPHIPEPIRGRRVLHVRYARVDGQPRLPAALANAPAPILGGIRPLPYRALPEIHAEPTHAKPTLQDSALLKDLPLAAVDRFLEASLDDSLALTVRELRLLGGRLSAPTTSPDAVAGRAAAFSLFALGDAPEDRVEDVSRGLDAVIAAVGPWSTGAVFPSFAGHGRGVGPIDAAWSPAALARLRAVRADVDPDGRFDPNLRWTRGAPSRRHDRDA